MNVLSYTNTIKFVVDHTVESNTFVGIVATLIMMLIGGGGLLSFVYLAYS